jgi:hypothetical protein
MCGARIDALSHNCSRIGAGCWGELQAVSGIDPANAIQAVQDELAIIEAGLEELRPPPGALPENEWS